MMDDRKSIYNYLMAPSYGTKEASLTMGLLSYLISQYMGHSTYCILKSYAFYNGYFMVLFIGCLTHILTDIEFESPNTNHIFKFNKQAAVRKILPKVIWFTHVTMFFF